MIFHIILKYEIIKMNSYDVCLACEFGDLDNLKQLVSLGFDPKTHHNYGIRWASINGHLHIVKYLVGLGSDPKAKDNYAIRWASEYGHLEVVKYLFELGCDPKAKDNYAIRMASYYGHLEVVKYLVSLGCDHCAVNIKYKYEVLQDVKHRLLTFLNKTYKNKYIKMEIIKRIIPSFTEHQIMTLKF